MDITTLAAWGEFIGGIAVVVSLIYLASQIRQNSRQMRATTAFATSELSFQQSALLSQDPDLNRIYWDGLADRDSLSEADQRRFDPLITAVTEMNRHVLRAHRDGLVTDEVWADTIEGMRFLSQQRGFQQWWARWRHNFGGHYVETFDRLIREGETAG
jgi:hypothetical protein